MVYCFFIFSFAFMYRALFAKIENCSVLLLDVMSVYYPRFNALFIRLKMFNIPLRFLKYYVSSQSLFMKG